MKRFTALAVAMILIGACQSDRSSYSGTTANSEPTGPTISTTEATEATAATDTPIATSTSAPCVPAGATGPQRSDDPLLMSSLVGDDIRTGTHPCFERIVIELGGTGDFPGWTVEYVDDPVRLGESDEFVHIAGTATLQVTMRMWMPTLEGGGYVGPIQFAPDNVFHILELRKTENHEGTCIWSIGLDAVYAFTVNVLHSPERLVIDVEIPVES